jgi:hypothetical protein
MLTCRWTAPAQDDERTPPWQATKSPSTGVQASERAKGKDNARVRDSSPGAGMPMDGTSAGRCWHADGRHQRRTMPIFTAGMPMDGTSAGRCPFSPHLRSGISLVHVAPHQGPNTAQGIIYRALGACSPPSGAKHRSVYRALGASCPQTQMQGIESLLGPNTAQGIIYRGQTPLSIQSTWCILPPDSDARHRKSSGAKHRSGNNI